MSKPTVFMTVALLLAMPVHANALHELREVLSRLSAHSPLKASVQLKSEGRSSDGDDTELNLGLATVQAEDGPQGLMLTFPQAALAQATQEEAARAANPKAAAPTSTGLRNLGFNDVRELTRAAEHLRRSLTHATLKAERSEAWQGKPARVLVFEVPQARRDRYVKKYESTLEVWLGADGVPLASRNRERLEGSAFVVVNFEVQNTDEQVFAVVGKRLVATQRTTTTSGSGAGQRGSSRREFTLQPQS